MPKLVKAPPKYRHHKGSGQAVVTIQGQDHYLGPWRSKASKLEYDRLAALEHPRNGCFRGNEIEELDTVVGTLILASIGLAGPTWEREETPFSEDTAPLVLALQLSPTMDAKGLQRALREALAPKPADRQASRPRSGAVATGSSDA